MIIGLHSAAPRSGKDTSADHLVANRGFYKDSFGRGIYEEVSVAFGVTIEQLQSHQWKTQPQKELGLARCMDKEFHNRIQALFWNRRHQIVALNTSRQILQWWGTEYRRRDNELYWVDSLASRVEGTTTDIVISDVREPHEVQYIYALAAATGEKFAIVELIRESAAQYRSNHTSDAGLPREMITHTIHNIEGCPEVMLAELDTIVTSLM